MRCIVLVLILAAAVSCGRAEKRCPACERPECVGAAFRIVTTDGRSVETCCVRCGFHYAPTVDARELWATDRATGQWIDATKAVYVEGSDVAGCAGLEARRDAQGCCYVKGFDRCLPSLIAFRDRTAAGAFQAEHGGQLITFAQIGSQ